MITKTIAEDGLVADLFHDGSGQPRKPIVLLGGSEGGKAWSSWGTKKIRNHLTDLGYTLFSLAYFKSPGLPPTCEEIPLEYFEKAFAWLAKQPEVLSDDVALMGSSKGGEVGLLLASMNPRIKAVVALSPSSIVWHGVPKIGSELKTQKSSWTYQGKALPFVPIRLSSWNAGTVIATMLTAKLRKAYEEALQNSPQVEAAAIPVEKIQGAILLVSGKRDYMWPSTPMCEQIVTRLATHGFAYPYQHIAYDAGHSGYVAKPECLQTISAFLQDHYA